VTNFFFVDTNNVFPGKDRDPAQIDIQFKWYLAQIAV
jgi:hypothetical protein